jgi:predicted metal-dependent hydrolase
MEGTKEYNNIKYQIKKSSRKTMSLSFDGNVIIVKAPESFSESKIESYIRSNEIKITEALRLASVEADTKNFIDGEDFYFLGKNYRLKIIDNDTSKLSLEGNYFIMGQFQDSDFKSIFEEWYSVELNKVLKERIEVYGKVFNLSPSKVTVENLKEKWGVCTPKGHIKINWRLAMAPLSIIDYIIIHELIHLEIKDHSKKFWNRLESIIPKYRSHVRWLKEHGNELNI